MKFGVVVNLIVASAFVSCATVNKMPPPELPAFVYPMFSSCRNIDGAGGLRLFKGVEFLGSSELEYSADQAGQWTVLLADSMGPELVKIQSTGLASQNLLVSGPLAAKFPEIAVKSDGYVTVDGHFTGIRVDEVPCFASFRFPQAWHQHLKEVRRKDGELDAVFEDNDRRIEFSLHRKPNPKDSRACALIESVGLWSSFRAKWKLCTGIDGKSWATLDGFQGRIH